MAQDDLPHGTLPLGMRLDDIPKDVKQQFVRNNGGRIRKLVDVDKFLAEHINNFRHAQQIDTENAAIRRLIISGLRAERETPRVESRTARDADLRARLAANAGEMCTDLVLLHAISDAKNYMVAGVFVPIDPCTAADRIIDNDPLWVMRGGKDDEESDAQELQMRDVVWAASLKAGKSIGEVWFETMERFFASKGLKPKFTVHDGDQGGTDRAVRGDKS